MGSIVEAQGEKRHEMLVGDYLQAVDDGKSALIIAPTHSEGEKLTEQLRTALKERGAIGEEKSFTARRSTGWTDAERGDYRNYEPGMVVEFNQAVPGSRMRVEGKRVTLGGFAKGEAAVVTGIEDGKVKLLKRDGKGAELPEGSSERFQVFRTRDIAIGPADRLRVTKNGGTNVEGRTKGVRINNGDIFSVQGFTKEGDIRLENGKVLPKNFSHISLGYVDTSYAGQDRG
jgi:hypothetical protein